MENSLHQDIDALLKNEVIDRHSLFQLKYFVIGKEPTTQAKLHRCLKELRARRETIDAILLEIAEKEDDLELLRLDLKSQQDQPDPTPEAKARRDIQQRKIQRRIVASEKGIADIKKKLKYVEEEAGFFLKAFRSLEAVEKLKPFDDLESQKDYWNNKLAEELRLRLLLRQSPDLELTKTILALDDRMEIKQAMVNLLTVAEQEHTKQIEQKK